MADPLEGWATHIKRVRVELSTVEDGLSAWNATEHPVISVHRRASVSTEMQSCNEGQMRRLSCPKLSHAVQLTPKACTCALLNQHCDASHQCAQCLATPRLFTEFPCRSPKRMQVSVFKRSRKSRSPASYHNVMSLLEKRRNLLPLVSEAKKKPEKKVCNQPVKQLSAGRCIRRASIVTSELRGQRVHRCFNFLLTK